MAASVSSALTPPPHGIRFAVRFLRALIDQVTHSRIDRGAPGVAREDAVMAAAGDRQAMLARRVEPGAEVVCRVGLAQAANVVPLAFHGDQRCAADNLRVDGLATHLPDAAGQAELLKDRLNRLQVVSAAM